MKANILRNRCVWQAKPDQNWQRKVKINQIIKTNTLKVIPMATLFPFLLLTLLGSIIAVVVVKLMQNMNVVD
ncbi:hypothetical protein [Thermoflexibacter ruber]|nr:hypothetical protein [Thermoflexibacter ruber]